MPIEQEWRSCFALLPKKGAHSYSLVAIYHHSLSSCRFWNIRNTLNILSVVGLHGSCFRFDTTLFPTSAYHFFFFFLPSRETSVMSLLSISVWSIDAPQRGDPFLSSRPNLVHQSRPPANLKCPILFGATRARCGAYLAFSVAGPDYIRQRRGLLITCRPTLLATPAKAYLSSRGSGYGTPRCYI